MEPGEPAVDLGRLVMGQPQLNLRGLQGYAGHCAHVEGWEARRKASHRWMGRLMKTRALFERHGLPTEIVTGGSSGTFDIDIELEGLTELQSGSYCVMDLDYRRIGGKTGNAYDAFEMALTVLTTVVSRPSIELAIVDAGFKSFSTDRPFVPETVEWPGLEYSWAGDEHGRLTIQDPARAPRLGDRIEFFPPHCDPTINLYDRFHVMRGNQVEAVWEISGRGRSQ
jgi:D-serine deaminase-like pyridoxal phosphate-dependent protein